MNRLRPTLFGIFRWLVRAGIRLGYNLMEEPRTKAVYDRTYDLLRPRGRTEITLRDRPFRVDADARGLAPKLLLLGAYEPHLTRVVERMLMPGMTVVDIGANIGYFTAVAAERIGPAGRVIAFEPDPQNCDLLRINARHMANTKVDIAEYALSDREGVSRLYRDFRSSSRSTLVSAAVRRPGGKIDVPVTTLDAYFGCSGTTIDFIKMDAEGSEGAIVLGGLRTIERWRPVIMMEFWPFAMAENGTDPQRILDLLSNLGYDFDRILPDARLKRVEPGHLVTLATARLPSGKGHLDLLLQSSKL